MVAHRREVFGPNAGGACEFQHLTERPLRAQRALEDGDFV
jgi:hypothetical protein